MAKQETSFPAFKIRSRQSGSVCYAALLPVSYYVDFVFYPYEQGEFEASFADENAGGDYRIAAFRNEYEQECWVVMSSLTEHTIHTGNGLLIHYDPLCPSAEELWKDLLERTQQFREGMAGKGYAYEEEQVRAIILGIPAELAERMLQVSPGASKFRRATEISEEEQTCFAQVRQAAENEKDRLVQELREKNQIRPEEAQKRQEEFIYNVLHGWDYGRDVGETGKVGTVATEWKETLKGE